MTGVFKLILILASAFILWRFASYVSKRIGLLRCLSQLKKECDAKITLHKSPFRPMWRASKEPDVTVKILDTVYLIRLYSGISPSRSVHFANEEYSCIYLRLRVSARAPHGTGANSLAMTPGVNISAKVRRTPPLEIPQEYDGSGKKVVKVMLMNPAPNVLSYVTPEKTSIKIAFTGDELHGQKVFTAETFMRYADRMKREEERLMKDDPDEIEYIGKN